MQYNEKKILDGIRECEYGVFLWKTCPYSSTIPLISFRKMVYYNFHYEAPCPSQTAHPTKTLPPFPKEWGYLLVQLAYYSRDIFVLVSTFQTPIFARLKNGKWLIDQDLWSHGTYCSMMCLRILNAPSSHWRYLSSYQKRNRRHRRCWIL